MSTDHGPARRLGWIDAVPAAGAVALAALVLRGFALRLRHPFDLEWMEGGMLGHAWRLVHGRALYPEAGPEWIPYVYPPGYAAVLAALSPVTGLDYGPGRAVSVVGTLVAAAAAVWLFARRGHALVGGIVAGCFLGCWRASGAFYDLVRPDGLAIGLLAATVAVAFERRRWAPVGAGVLLCLAFVVKHHSAAFGVPLVAALWLRDGRAAAVRFALASAVPAGLFTAVAAAVTGGRFLEYLLVVPATHPVIAARVVPGTPGELGAWLLPGIVLATVWLLAELVAVRREVPAAVLLGLPAVGAVAVGGVAAANPEVPGVAMPAVSVLTASAACLGAAAGAGVAHAFAAAVERLSGTTRADPRRARWWTAWGLGGTALVVATWMRGHNGGFLNVLIPAHLAICVGMGLAALGLRERWPGPAATIGTSLVLALQVGWLARQLDVEEVLPTPEDVAGGQAVVERLRACPDGPILSPHAAWLPVQAGREPSPHLIAIWDIRYEDGPFFDGMARLAEAARAHRWACVVKGGRQALGFQIEQQYHLVDTFRIPPKALMPKTGWRVRPTELLEPGAPPPRPRRAP